MVAPGCSVTAFDLPEQLVEERDATQLPVTDVQPAALLHGDRPVYRTVLDLLELLRAQPAIVERGTRAPRVARAQQGPITSA
jgi:hypothetical protein